MFRPKSRKVSFYKGNIFNNKRWWWWIELSLSFSLWYTTRILLGKKNEGIPSTDMETSFSFVLQRYTILIVAKYDTYSVLKYLRFVLKQLVLA